MFKRLTFFPITINFTLTFDFVTLSFCQLNFLVYINHMCQYHEDPTIRSWIIHEKRFPHNCTFDLDLCPRDLDLMSTESFHRYQSYILISFRSNLPFMFYRRTNVFKWLLIWPWTSIMWPWPYINLMFLFVSIISVNIMKIQPFIHDLYAKKGFPHNCTFDLNLWPCDLDLMST